MPGRPSQAEFAQLVGFSKNTVVRYERDKPGADKPVVVLRWAQVTGFDPEWLWRGDDDDPESAHPGLVTWRYLHSARLAA